MQILQLALMSDSSSYRLLEKEADRLKKEFEKVGGIKKVKIWAYPEQEIRISVDLQRMAQNNLSLNQVMGAIQAANQNIPGGFVDIGAKRFNVKTSGSYESLEDIENTVISSAENNILYLSDIAEVTSTYEDNNYFARFKGKKALYITASQKVGTNIFTIREALEERISEFQRRIAIGYEIRYCL